MFLRNDLDILQLGLLGLLALFILTALFFHLGPVAESSFPLINEKEIYEITSTRSRTRFLKSARNLIQGGLKQASIFRIVTDNGIEIVLSPEYANEIRSHPGLSVGGTFAKDFHVAIPGFEPFRLGASQDEIFHSAVRVKLNQALGDTIQSLSSEAAIVLERTWTNETAWHEITLKPTILQLVAQLSSKVFLGDKICRNPDWLRITINYALDSFTANYTLRLWPGHLHWLVSKLLPSCRKLRRELKEARAIITPVLQERRRAKEIGLKNGEQQHFIDAIQWMEDIAQGRPYDAAEGQLAFSLGSIHSTTDMFTQVLLDIGNKPDLIQQLREEVIAVVQKEGWQKSTIYNLKLMDSVLKESQRMKPLSITTLRRLALEDIRLSDGQIIPKGSYIMVANNKMWDPKVYPNPDVFDPYRFLKMREIPGRETSAQLVSASPEHMGFGLGKHLCPGRFLAANEIKITLAHMLLKYDFHLTKDYKRLIYSAGIFENVDPMAKIAIKRRQEEIVL